MGTIAGDIPRSTQKNSKIQSKHVAVVGVAFPHQNGMQSCPARGKECHDNCGKTGHFAKFCRSAKKSNENIRNVEQPKREYLQDSDDENCDSIQLVLKKAKIRVYGSEDPIELAGKFKTTIQSSTGQHTDATFYVTSGQCRSVANV